MEIRSILKLGTFSDNEKGGGERLVDESCYESTPALINRLLRGDSLDSRFTPEYEIDENMTDDEAFDRLDITKTDGFDLADVARIRATADIAKAQLKAGQAKEKVEKEGITAQKSPIVDDKTKLSEGVN